MLEPDPALTRVKTHVKNVRDFFYHLMVFAFAGTLFVILDLRVDGGGPSVLGLDWAYWVILFWGIGVASHAITVFFDDERAYRIYEEEKRELVAH